MPGQDEEKVADDKEIFIPLDQPDAIDEVLGEGPEDDESEGEDLFREDLLEEDYKEDDELDQYDLEGIDFGEQEPLTLKERLAAEKFMRSRDNIVDEAKLDRQIAARFGEEAFSDVDDDSDVDTNDPQDHLRKLAESHDNDEMDLGDNHNSQFDLNNTKGPTRDHLKIDGYRKEVKDNFRNFLTRFVDPNGTNVYQRKIQHMCQNNLQSLEVNFVHLQQYSYGLAHWLLDAPADMLALFDEVAYSLVLTQFHEYARIHDEVNVRISNYTIRDSLRDLRHFHLNFLVKVVGVVTRRSGVFPHLRSAVFLCTRCRSNVGPISFSYFSPPLPFNCTNCKSFGPFSLIPEKTKFKNYQKLTLQESPGSVPPGRLPRTKEVILLGDLIDCARPGEEIELTGIYRQNMDSALNRKHGFPIFSTTFEANNISKKDDQLASFYITEEDESAIRQLATDPAIGEKLIDSIAPSIYGHRDIKTALALSLFGGVPKEHQHHRIRGDINVLVLGDPGTAKSQFLKYVEKTSHRAVYTTGQGASAVGLTAAVRHDTLTREWTLEGGALVLADNGVCLIDEFDKMNDKDRTSIHEAMEQQSISISKAGIVTSLQARCSVIAAANPVRGRYDPSISFAQNVDLTEPILSRFDVLCVVQDEVNEVLDSQLATFVVQSHMCSHPDSEGLEEEDSSALGGGVDKKQNLIDQTLLRKYIYYAKTKCHPKLANIERSHEKIASLYSDLRQASCIGGGMPMTVRHVESLLRMSEAHARMHLRTDVQDEDVNTAIKVLLNSFISAQKMSIRKSLEKSFKKYVMSKKDHNSLLDHLLSTVYAKHVNHQRHRSDLGIGSGSNTIRIPRVEFESSARDMELLDFSKYYESYAFTSKFLLEKDTIVSKN